MKKGGVINPTHPVMFGEPGLETVVLMPEIDFIRDWERKPKWLMRPVHPSTVCVCLGGDMESCTSCHHFGIMKWQALVTQANRVRKLCYQEGAGR